MTQIDELVKQLRDSDEDRHVFMRFEAAEALEAQAAEIASLKAELDIADKQLAETGRAWTADCERLETQLEAFRSAAEMVGYNCVPYMESGHYNVGIPRCAFDALMSALLRLAKEEE